jgi:hypothetical protein
MARMHVSRLALFLCLTLSSAIAHAEPATTPKAAAQERYSQGLRYYDAAEAKRDPSLYEAAYLQFVQAYALYADDKILWNLAASEVRTKRHVDALKHLREYDRHKNVLAQPNHPDRAQLMTFLDLASKATGHIAVDAPAGARIRVDKIDVGAAPLAEPIDVAAGTHTVEAQIASGEWQRSEVDARAGAVSPVRFAAQAPAPSAAAPAPSVVVSAAPAPTAPPPGGEQPTSDRTSFFTARNTVALALGVGAVAGLTGGIIFVVGASSDNDKARALGAQIPGDPQTSCAIVTPTCAQFQDANHSAQDKRNASVALFATGGVLALGSGAVLLFWPQADAKKSAFIRPVVAPSFVGVNVAGSF